MIINRIILNLDIISIENSVREILGQKEQKIKPYQNSDLETQIFENLDYPDEFLKAAYEEQSFNIEKKLDRYKESNV